MNGRLPLPALRVGAIIREKRLAERMSAAKLASLLGVHRNTVWNWESGKGEPCASEIVLLAEILGCSVIDFFRED